MSVWEFISPRLRGRWRLLPILAGCAISALFFYVARDRELWVAWSRWVPFGLWPGFNDLFITLQHLREAEAGADPLGDPVSQFAYPRAVLELRHLGLQHIPAEWLGLIQGVLFTLTAVIVLRPLTWKRAIGVTVILGTPAVLLGFERGNLDLALFPLCAAAAWIWSRCDRDRTLALPLFFMVGAAVLKLYPMFGLLAGAFAETSRRRVYWLVGAGLVCLYCFLIRSDLTLIAEKIPVVTVASWGSLIVFARLETFLQEAHPDLWLSGLNWEVVALVIYGLVGLAAIALGRRLAPRFQSLPILGAEGKYFWVGAGICCGCFAGANFVYRWIFALLTLPLLFRAARWTDPVVSRWAQVTIGSMLVGLAAKFSLGTGPFLVVQLANWTCIASLIVGCAALRWADLRSRESDRAQEELADGADQLQPEKA